MRNDVSGEKIINDAYAKEAAKSTPGAPSTVSSRATASSPAAAAAAEQQQQESARLQALLASMSDGMDAEIERQFQEGIGEAEGRAYREAQRAAIAQREAAELAAERAAQQVAVAAERVAQAAGAASAGPPPPPPQAEQPPVPDPESLQRLMDMGFPRERCIEAIRYTFSNIVIASQASFFCTLFSFERQMSALSLVLISQPLLVAICRVFRSIFERFVVENYGHFGFMSAPSDSQSH